MISYKGRKKWVGGITKFVAHNIFFSVLEEKETVILKQMVWNTKM